MGLFGLATRPVAAVAPFAVRAPARPSLSVSLAEIFGGTSGRAGLEVPRPQNYAALERKYGSSAWVNICVRRKARDLASAPFVVTVTGADGKPVVTDSSHELAELLTRVNSWTTQAALIKYTSIYLDLTGNAFWLLLRNRAGRVAEVFPVNPFAVSIYEAEDGTVASYGVWHQNEEFRFRAWRPGQSGDLLHFRLENPTSDESSAFPSQWGVGPLEAAWTLVTTDEDAVRWNRALVRNDGRPTGMLMSDMDVSVEEATAAADRYRQTFAGPQGAGKILVTGKNLKYVRIADSPKEMDYLQSREMYREEIIAAFGMNSAILGLAQGDVGRRDEAHRDYWEGTILATSQSDVCPVINEFLAVEYGPDVRVSQDFSNVRALQENEEARSQFVHRYWQMGVPFDTLSARYKLGFGPVPGGARGYLPITLVPAETLPDEPGGPPTEEGA